MSETSVGHVHVGVDTGGTFTDLFAYDVDNNVLSVAKVASTPRHPSDAVVASVGRLGGLQSGIERIVVGSTIALNALLQRAGAQVVFVTTAGFEDIPHIQRINRQHLYDLQWQKGEALVRRSRTVGALERIDYRGRVVEALSPEEVDRVVAAVGEILPTLEHPAIAVSLLFSYVNARHEEMLKDALSKAFGGVAISVSSEVALIWREYERSSTTIADAYVKPIITDFTSSLVSDLRGAGVEAPISLMKSNGGQTPVDQAAGHSAALILSGLAGGLVAGKYYADLVGRPDVVTLDMGGTSADVGVIHKGSISYRESYDIEWAIPVVGSFIDMTSIGAGGSSIAAFDRGGFLKVGPESAAADPGPASYGHGGEEPTVTDANLVLGRLDPDFFLGGEMPLRPELARSAVEKIARRLDSSVEDAALAIVRLANENMANAVRLLTVDRGFDHRTFDLLTFGGAGPLHAADLASSLGMRRVIVPLHPGITSAFGAMVASPRVDRRWTRAQNTETVSTSDLNEAFSWLVTAAVGELHREGYQGPVEVLRTVSMRYLGQNYEQEIPVPEGEIDDSTVATLVERYHHQHEAFYGYAMRENVCELAHFNVTAIGHVKPPSLPLLSEHTEVRPIAERLVYFRDTGWSTSAIYRRESLGSGTRITGPAVVQELDSTTVVSPGQVLTVDEHGVMFLEV